MSSSTSSNSASRKPTSPALTKDERLARSWRRGLTPPPRISVPDWADRYRKLAPEAGSTSGAWRTKTVEIARGPMLAVTELGVETIAVMVCTQLMKTALIENAVGFFAHLDPAPMLIVQPKEAAAEQFSKERITPLIRATPVLRDLIGTKKTRSAEETLLYKSFPGGFLALAGAGSPDNLARRPVKRVFCDETDKYPITREGDPIGLADERMATYVGALSVRACSPTIEGESLIESSYLEGDQRQASLACPECGHRQFLEFFRHIDWKKDYDEDGNVIAHHPRTAQVYCEACGVGWSEGQRLTALGTIRWHQTRRFRCCEKHVDPLAAYEASWKAQGAAGDPDAPVAHVWDWWEGPRHAVYRVRCPDCGTWPVSNEHASFTAGKVFSPWPRDAPPKIAAKWLSSKNDPDKRVKFDNTQLGKPHKRSSSKEVVAELLAARAEIWAAEVPDGVGVITVGGDTQDDRVELEFVGWGRNEESWSLAYVVVEGDTSKKETWDEVDRQLLRTFQRADGRQFAVEAACIDSGGHRAKEVYEFSKARLGRKVWATKGASDRNGKRSPLWPTVRPSNRTRTTFKPVLIGVNSGKDTLRSRLTFTEPGPGYMHFSSKRELSWYEQLTAERLIPKVASERVFTIWDCPKGKANEATDCRVNAMAALAGLQQLGMKLNTVVDAVSPAPEALTPAKKPQAVVTEGAPAAPPAKPSKFAVRKGSSWMNRRR
jgi:phage terminase large subunit GpA-like protein